MFLPVVKNSLRPDFHVAAQNCWVKKGGAFTGEVRYALMIFISYPSILFLLTTRHEIDEYSVGFELPNAEVGLPYVQC